MFSWSKGVLPGALLLAATACAAPAASAQGERPVLVPSVRGQESSAEAALIVPGAAAVGTLEWRFNAGSSLPAAPAVGPDGTVYLGTGDGTVQAVAPEGSLRWSFTVEGAVAASPLIDSEGRVLVATSAARIYAFWPAGERAWMLRMKSSPATELVPAPALGGVIVGAADGGVWALSERGSALWHTEAGAPLSSVLGVAGRRIVVATHGGDACLFEGAVKRARAPLGAAPRGAAIVFDDGAAAVVAGSSLVRVDGAGQVLWSREHAAWLGGSATTLLSIEDERVDGEERAALVRLAPDGRVLGKVGLPGRASGPPIADEHGVVYVSGDAGELWAVRVDGTVARTRIGRMALHRPVLDLPRRRVVVAAGGGGLTMLELTGLVGR